MGQRFVVSYSKGEHGTASLTDTVNTRGGDLVFWEHQAPSSVCYKEVGVWGDWTEGRREAAYSSLILSLSLRYQN